MNALFIILVALIGFSPDENNRNISHPTPSGDDSPSVAAERLAKGAFGSRMKEIPLTNSPLKAIVDDEDYERVKGKIWYLTKRGGFVATSFTYPSGAHGSIHMQIFLFDCPNGLVRDHWDHNRLDNRRENIRLCTNTENVRNALPWRKQTTSQYKGVSWHKAARKWSAYIRFNRAHIYLGLFSSETDAAVAYNTAALDYHGEFAQVNQL